MSLLHMCMEVSAGDMSKEQDISRDYNRISFSAQLTNSQSLFPSIKPNIA